MIGGLQGLKEGPSPQKTNNFFIETLSHIVVNNFIPPDILIYFSPVNTRVHR